MAGLSLYTSQLNSPIGELVVVGDTETIRALEFVDCSERMWKHLRRRYGNFTVLKARKPADYCARIEAYFSGELEAINELPADPAGTPFQQRVWTALRSIPAATTMSYRALAAELELPRSIRAVGRANALNPISVVVPCHRLIGADGTLRGYAGGLQRKRWLLQHEGVDFS